MSKPGKEVKGETCMFKYNEEDSRMASWGQKWKVDEERRQSVLKKLGKEQDKIS